MADSTLENQTGQSHGGGSMVAEGGPIIDNSITSQCLSSDISVLSNPRNMSSEGQSFVNFDDTSSLFSITSSLSAPELQQRLVQVIQENKLLKDAVERNTSLMRQVAGWRDQIFKMSEDIEHNRQMHEQAKNTIISLNLEKEQCEKRMKALEKIVQESTEEEASGDSTHLIDHRLADLRDTVAELCAENSRLLQEKTQAEVENAKLNDCLWSLKDEQACGGAGAASMLNDYAVVRHLSNGKAELEDPSLPQNYIKDNDSQMLKAQVMSLVRELQNLEKKRLEPTDELKMAHSQIEELQRQLVVSEEAKKHLQKHDDTLIDSLRINVANLEAALDAERKQSQTDQRKLAETRAQYERLCKDFQELSETLEHVSGNHGDALPDVTMKQLRQQSQQIDNLLARLMTSEDLVSSKDQEICALSEELRKLREDLETIPVLKAQMDIYHADFQAERSARERQHDEMEQLRIQLEQFRAHMSPSHEAQQLQSQSQPQPTSNASRSGRYRRSYPYPGPYDEPDDQADTLTDQLATRNLDGEPMPSEQQNMHLYCPKCRWMFTDFSALQHHVQECLGLPSIS